MKKIALSLATLAATSCSLQLDSQYGLRWEPSPIRSHGDEISAVFAESRINEAVPEVPAVAVLMDPRAHSTECVPQGEFHYNQMGIANSGEATRNSFTVNGTPLGDDRVPESGQSYGQDSPAPASTVPAEIPGGPDFLFGFRFLINLSLLVMTFGGILLWVGWALGEYATLWGGIIFGIGALGFLLLVLWWLFVY
jgi:hypothetical protein